MLLVVYLVLGVWKGVTGNDDLCDNSAYRACELPDDFGFPKTQEDWNRICPTLRETLYCLEEYSDKCGYDDVITKETLKEMRCIGKDACREEPDMNIGVIGKDDLCDTPVYRACETPRDVSFPETEEDVDQVCPLLLENLDCMIDYADKCEYADVFSKEILSDQRSVADDMCRKDSPLHLGIVQNIGCFSEAMEKDSEDCITYVRSKGKVMKEYIRKTEEERGYDEDTIDEDLWMAYSCLMDIFRKTCAISKTSERCGHDAKNIVVEILTRANTAFRTCYAVSEEKLAELLALLDLELEEEISLSTIFLKE